MLFSVGKSLASLGCRCLPRCQVPRVIALRMRPVSITAIVLGEANQDAKVMDPCPINSVNFLHIAHSLSERHNRTKRPFLERGRNDRGSAHHTMPLPDYRCSKLDLSTKRKGSTAVRNEGQALELPGLI